MWTKMVDDVNQRRENQHTQIFLRIQNEPDKYKQRCMYLLFQEYFSIADDLRKRMSIETEEDGDYLYDCLYGLDDLL